METFSKIKLISAYPLIALIWVYQHTLSPDHSWVKIFYPYGYCKFHPSCSQFAMIVLKTEGLVGLPKIIRRVLSCTPNSLGGIDHPYKKISNS